MEIDVFTDDINEDNSISYPADNGPGLHTMYMPTENIRYNPHYKFVSFSGYFMGSVIETRIPFELIKEIHDTLKL